MTFRSVDIFLDDKHLLYVRRNGTWVIRQLSNREYEHPFSGRAVKEGHVIARGKIRPPSTLVVTRSELSLPRLRTLVGPSGESYGIKIVRKGEAKGEGASSSRRIRAPLDPSTMTAGQINKALDRLDKADSENNRAFIEAGRGYERPSEYLDKTDPLSTEARRLWEERKNLRREIERRYGPGAPSRLPSRGFGPVRR